MRFFSVCQSFPRPPWLVCLVEWRFSDPAHTSAVQEGGPLTGVPGARSRAKGKRIGPAADRTGHSPNRCFCQGSSSSSSSREREREREGVCHLLGSFPEWVGLHSALRILVNGDALYAKMRIDLRIRLMDGKADASSSLAIVWRPAPYSLAGWLAGWPK